MSKGDITHLEAIPLSEWMYVSAGLVWATRREVEEGLRDAVYGPDNHVVAWLVVKGEASMGSTVAREGEWMFPGSRKGRQKFRAGSVIVSLRFFAEWPTGKALFDHESAVVLSAEKEPKLTQAGEALELMVREVVKKDGFFLLSQGTADVESYFAIRQAFENWMLAYVQAMLRLGKAPSAMHEVDPRVQKAVRLMDSRSARREREVAKAVGLSVSQLNRLFHSDLGISPRAYLQRRRIEAAILLLKHGGRPIKEIAYELGFNSISNFSNWFYRQKGCFPRAFQKDE